MVNGIEGTREIRSEFKPEYGAPEADIPRRWAWTWSKRKPFPVIESEEGKFKQPIRFYFSALRSAPKLLWNGTPADVRNQCEKIIKAVAPSNNLVFGPCTGIQALHPIENIEMIYHTARAYNIKSGKFDY